MQAISETHFRKIGGLLSNGVLTDEEIGRRVEVNRSLVTKFKNGALKSAAAKLVFEEMTRPSGCTKAQHEAWLRENGYEGWQ